jgi:hypothetical protein
MPPDKLSLIPEVGAQRPVQFEETIQRYQRYSQRRFFRIQQDRAELSVDEPTLHFYLEYMTAQYHTKRKTPFFAAHFYSSFFIPLFIPVRAGASLVSVGTFFSRSRQKSYILFFYKSQVSFCILTVHIIEYAEIFFLTFVKI